ncbi:MAG: alpha-E domain-containing protein [Opitutales bacterium]|nr:alpha-E domain-containing protein [Opitutales bacterium]
MLSRVANSLYWIGRYIERAENTARILDVNLQLLDDFEAYVDGVEEVFWEAIVQSTGDVELFREHHDGIDADGVTAFLTREAHNPNSIFSSVSSARENARMIRDQISEEMWECINEMYHFVRNEQEFLDNEETTNYDFFEEIKNYSYRFVGLMEATYFHSEGYKFLQVGRYLERADQTSRILDLKYFLPLPDGQQGGGTVDIAIWVAILRSSSAVDAFQSNRTGEADALNVSGFLILSQNFPRSIRYCLRQLEQQLRSISGTDEGFYANRAEKLAGRLMGDVAYASIDDIWEEGLHEFIDRVQLRLIGLNQSIYEEYFQLPAVDMEAEIAVQRSQQQ